MRLHRPYRVGILTWFARALLAFGGLFAVLVISTVLFGDGDEAPGARPQSLGARLVALLFVGAFVAAWLTFMAAMARLGVLVDDEGVVVRALRTDRYPWDEIAGFDTGRLDSVDFSARRRPLIGVNPAVRRLECLRIHLTDGRTVVVEEVNASVSTWLGTRPPEIARRLEACRPPRPPS